MTSFIELADVYTIIVIYLFCFLIMFFYHLFLLFHSVESSETHSDAFKNIGEKWRCLLEEQKDVFRKKAIETDKDVCSPSNSQKAGKIIKNMMKEVCTVW